MKKKILLASALLGLLLQSAGASPIGWYSLSETWRDGSFTGRFYYDGTTDPVKQITGTLTDIAQATAITTVWQGEKPAGASWTFVNNASSSGPDNYDAGFYLNLLDLGTSLTLDVAADNGLYDWSHDFAFFQPAQLNGSPLLSFEIAAIAEVPEPSTLAIVSTGLLLCWFTHRRKPLAR